MSRVVAVTTRRSERASRFRWPLHLRWSMQTGTSHDLRPGTRNASGGPSMADPARTFSTLRQASPQLGIPLRQPGFPDQCRSSMQVTLQSRSCVRTALRPTFGVRQDARNRPICYYLSDSGKRAGHFCRPPALHPRAGADRLTFCQHTRVMPREHAHCRTGTYDLYAPAGIAGDRVSAACGAGGAVPRAVPFFDAGHPAKPPFMSTVRVRPSLRTRSVLVTHRSLSGGASRFRWPPALSCRTGTYLHPRGVLRACSLDHSVELALRRTRLLIAPRAPLGAACFSDRRARVFTPRCGASGWYGLSSNSRRSHPRVAARWPLS